MSNEIINEQTIKDAQKLCEIRDRMIQERKIRNNTPLYCLLVISVLALIQANTAIMMIQDVKKEMYQKPIMPNNRTIEKGSEGSEINAQPTATKIILRAILFDSRAISSDIWLASQRRLACFCIDSDTIWACACTASNKGAFSSVRFCKLVDWSFGKLTPLVPCDFNTSQAAFNIANRSSSIRSKLRLSADFTAIFCLTSRFCF